MSGGDVNGVVRTGLAALLAAFLSPVPATAHPCCRVERLVLAISAVTVDGVAQDDLSAYDLQRSVIVESDPSVPGDVTLEVLSEEECEPDGGPCFSQVLSLEDYSPIEEDE